MTTPAMHNEVFTVALPGAIGETHGVVVVAAVELNRELGEAESFALGGITLRFFNLADVTAVHNFVVSLSGKCGCETNKKARGKLQPACFSNRI